MHGLKVREIMDICPNHPQSTFYHDMLHVWMNYSGKLCNQCNSAVSDSLLFRYTRYTRLDKCLNHTRADYLEPIPVDFLSQVKRFVVTNCSKEQPSSIVTETLKNGILIPIVTSKESYFNADFKYRSFIKISYTHQKLRAWENLPHIRK